jgi:hypothetical protein
MKAFFRTLFFSIILGAFMAVPASYFFVKDFVQPRVQETLSRIDTLNTDLQQQNQLLEQILSRVSQSN